MRTIRVIYHAGLLRLLGPVDLPEDTPLTFALLTDDDVPATGIASAADSAKALEFLHDPREDVYGIHDGEAA